MASAWTLTNRRSRMSPYLSTKDGLERGVSRLLRIFRLSRFGSLTLRDKVFLFSRSIVRTVNVFCKLCKFLKQFYAKKIWLMLCNACKSICKHRLRLGLMMEPKGEHSPHMV